MTDPVTGAVGAGAVGAAVGARWHEPPAADVAAVLTNLTQLYALLADQGRAAALAELFTPDAEWDGTELTYGTATGADDIARHVTGHFRANEPMMHLPGPPLLVANRDDEVEGVSWCFATRWRESTPVPLILFYYEDTFRRDGGRWRFARRVLRRRMPAG